MAKKNEIIVKDVAIKTMSKDGIDYISITDIARQKNTADPNGVIANIYAEEADVLNVAMFGMTAKQWREANPDLKGNIRDYATINELIMPVEYGEYQCCAYQ